MDSEYLLSTPPSQAGLDLLCYVWSHLLFGVSSSASGFPCIPLWRHAGIDDGMRHNSIVDKIKRLDLGDWRERVPHGVRAGVGLRGQAWPRQGDGGHLRACLTGPL
jgi:hypothetical protein